MDTARFDLMLKEQLSDVGSATFTADMRMVAMSAAVRAYSRYTDFTRRYGTGHVYQAAAATQAVIYAVGGPYAVGAVLTIDAGTPWAETKTIQTVAISDLPTDLLVGTPVKITFTTNLATPHAAGAFITQTNLGLQVVAGTDTYALPFDFISPERESWDIATGGRLWRKRQESFYDGVYRQSRAIGGVGFGQSVGFGSNGTVGLVGVPAAADSSIVVAGSVMETEYIFDDGYPPMLQITPVPTQNVRYDFRYVAQQLPQNVPDAAIDALLDYAIGSAMLQLANTVSNGSTDGDLKEGDESASPSKVIAELTNTADQHFSRFDKKIRSLPFMCMG